MPSKKNIKKLLFDISLIDEYIKQLIEKGKQVKRRVDMDTFKDMSLYPLYSYIFIIFDYINNVLQENGVLPYEKKTIFNIRSAFAHPETLVMSLTISMDGWGYIKVIKKANISKGKKYPRFEKKIILFRSRSGNEKGPWFIEETYIDTVRNKLKGIIDEA